MQESYLPLKPSHAPGTSCSYTAVMSFGTTWKDFGGNILACPSLKRTFACTFLAIYYNKQAALKLITTSLLFLDFCLFVWKILNWFPPKGVWEWSVSFRATPFWGPARSEHQAAQLSGFMEKGRARRASFWWTGTWHGSLWKGCFQPIKFSCKRKRLSSLPAINHILKSGTTGRTGTCFLERGARVCNVLSC